MMPFSNKMPLFQPGRAKDWEIVHGETIKDLTEKDWDRIISRNSLVFSRTTPEQKLMIVEQAQKRKQIIAMTGDGVNDAPALKKSDIGVGMGSGKSYDCFFKLKKASII